MKVLYVNTHDLAGGASRAAYRLACGVRDQGCSIGLLVGNRSGDDRDCFTPPRGFGDRLALRCRYRAEAWALNRYPHSAVSPWSSNLLPDAAMVRSIGAFAPDLVHLHWIGGGHLPIPSLARLRRPLIWTLHDMWPMTGGCHYSDGCPGYLAQCGACPQLGQTRSFDLSRLVWLAKNHYWRSLDLTLVSPSRWLAERATSSSLFRDRAVEVIPNGLDVTRFKPVDRGFARAVLNLPQDRPLVLFGAVSARDDMRKGYGALLRAQAVLARLPSPPELVVFGASGPGDGNEPLPTHFVGRVHDDATLSLLYSAADLFVAPSAEENLSNVVMEAMACGTPGVAFAIGGMPELLDHQVNGYLAQPGDSEDLAQGISWILGDRGRADALGAAARKKVERRYSIDTVARQYQELYGRQLKRAAHDGASQKEAAG